MAVDLHEEYNQLPGKVFRWWAFSSTSMSEELALGFTRHANERTIFTIDAIGVDIAAFSAFPGEGEVLMLPGTSLMVEPGVMVQPGTWKFEASVWEAVRQEGTPAASPQSLPDGDLSPNDITDNGECIHQFQMTDLPHPDWEQIVYSMHTDAYT